MMSCMPLDDVGPNRASRCLAELSIAQLLSCPGFYGKNPEFVIEQPKLPFSESTLTEGVTHWPDAWLRRVR
jgi:hypothetical protein